MNLADFRAMTFDCYGTLVDWESGILHALRRWRERTGVNADDESLLAAFGEAEAAREAAVPTAPYPQILELVLADLAQRLGVDATEDERRRFGSSVGEWPAFPDSADALRTLKERYKLVVVSNVDRESFARSNARFGVEFDAVITAGDIGSYKPAARHFEEAFARLAGLGVQRKQILHVAQSLFHDHEPAKALGMQTAWINRRAGNPGWGATRRAAGQVRPDFVFQRLDELARACGAAWSSP
jgi:2-haloalkanoic acid dehalogenase type II